MSDSRDLLPGQTEPTDLPANQVQFALVLSRMLDTVKDDAEARRQMVYDLARYKLREQFTYADAKNVDNMKQALEVAIEGVEKFSREQAPLERLPQHQLTSSKVTEAGPVLVSGDATVLSSGIGRSRGKLPAVSGPLLPVIKRTAAILVVVGVVMVIVSQRDRIAAMRRVISSQTPEIALVAPKPETSITVAKPEMMPAAPPQPTRVLPTDYGIYALIDDKSLTELRAIAVMAPDMRIAISPEFKKPDRPHLSNGRVKFIVFRRDMSNVIPERVEVRVVAKVREFSTGTVKTPGDGEDSGVIRNFSYPFRISPIPGKAEMYELHASDADLELPPGHYVLSLGLQAYYFQVDGEITDPRQCLERVAAGNGTFYSPCQKAPTY